MVIRPLRNPIKEEETEQDETQQPPPAALFSGIGEGSGFPLLSTLAPAGDGACSLTLGKKLMHYIIEDNEVVCPVAGLRLEQETANGRAITTASFSCSHLGLMAASEIALATKGGAILFILVRNASLADGHIFFEGVVTEQAQGDAEMAASSIERFESRES